MKPHNIHIVFGRAGKTLIDSNAIDLSKNQIISIYDNLNIGPLCDIQENENIQKRKDWLQNAFMDISYFNQISDFVENDLDSVISIVRDADTIDKIFLWTGYFASEMISTARLMPHLSNLHKSVFIANFPTIPVKSIHGNIVTPKNLMQTAIFQVKDILEQFKPVTKSEFSSWENLWNKVLTENSQLRILDRNGEISGKDVDYFDSFLLSNCNESYQKSAMIIGKTLVDIDFAVDDEYLNWRLKQLAFKRKIEPRGRLIEIRDYEIKEISTANNDLS